MKRSLKDLTGFSIETLDGKKGKIRDFLFDEDNWKVRYLDADFGSFFKDKRVLLPVNVMKEPDWDSKIMPLDITTLIIDKSPSPEDKPTVSREYEKELMSYYGHSAYWSTGQIPPVNPGMFFPARPLDVPSKRLLEEKTLDTSMRSFKEVSGYHILANDGHLGHVEDVIIDNTDWQMIYLVVDTSNWLPWSKKVILLISWLKEISYETKEVSVDADTEVIRNAPEFDTEKPIEEAFEKALLDYYQREFS